ncbi:MAG TPA: hypothetical protein VLS89_13025 [Candidatus Nanopelagicales bacterium]|nr:hypothetical protein [Candidatus Nanopelagicales bacterium]
MRSTGAVLDLELQTFRRSLSSELGRSDKDYQKLRAERASRRDEEDDANAPPPPAEVKAAKPEDLPPTSAMSKREP